jgi:uncharacterized repeat protein (TIGR02543 family)
MFENMKLRSGDALVTGVVGKVAAWVIILAMLVTTVFTAPLFSGAVYATGDEDASGLRVGARNDNGDYGDEVTALAVAEAPSISKHPVLSSTYSLLAPMRMYLNASSPDSGYLTYQWYQSPKYTTAFPTESNGSLPAATVATIKAASGTIGGADGATLDITSPNAAGFYYYYAKVTNHKDLNGDGDSLDAGETTTIDSAVALAKVVDRSLEPKLMNGDFQTYDNATWFGYNGSTVTPPTTYYWSAVPLNASTINGKDTNTVVPYWDYTHDGGDGPYQFAGKVAELQWAGISGVGGGLATAGHSETSNSDIKYDWAKTAPIYIELSAVRKSSIYQEIATVPGKIYEWSLDFAAPSNNALTEMVAVVIGPAINEQSDYLSTTANKRWIGPADYIVQNSGSSQYALRNDTYRWQYPYGKNLATFFQDIVDAAGLPETAANTGTSYNEWRQQHNGDIYTVPYNGSTYYVRLVSDPGNVAANGNSAAVNQANWEHATGVYTVPEGQGTTVFGFVSVCAMSATGGNLLDNITFASGSALAPTDDISFTGDTTLSTATKAGYAYALAEVRGSTVSNLSGLSAIYDPAGAGAGTPTAVTTGLGTRDWYAGYTAYDMTAGSGTGTGFVDGGKITFTGLTPSKTYRIIGIPIGSISPGLKTNLSAAEVLDNGYYKDVKIKSVFGGDPSRPANVKIELYGSPVKERVLLERSRADLEYALLQESGTAGEPNTAAGSAAADWTAGNGATLAFGNLDPAKVYYLVSRPAGFIEVSYADAAWFFDPDEVPISPYLKLVALKIPSQSGVTDIAKGDVSRATGGATINVANTNALYQYYALDVSTNTFVDDFQGTGGAPIIFTGLDPAKTYQIVKKLITDTSMLLLEGVRVYPYPDELHIDFLEEDIQNAGHVVDATAEYAIRKNPDVWLAGNAATYVPATGTSAIDLSVKATGSETSILDSIPAGGTGTIYYRTAAGLDGYTGVSVSPELNLTIPARPAAPTEGDVTSHDYDINYASTEEKVYAAIGGDIEIAQQSSSTWTTIAANGNALFTDIGWHGTDYPVNVRLKAVDAGHFASFTATDTIAGRPAAPEFTVTSSGVDLTVVGFVSGTDYEFKGGDPSNTSWGPITTISGGSVLWTYNLGDLDYEVRLAATDSAPYSNTATISTPIIISSVNIGTKTYGETLNSVPVTISNISGTQITTTSLSLSESSIVTDDGNFELNSSGGVTLDGTPSAGASNSTTYTITPKPGLNAGTYTATLTAKYESGGERTTKANVSITIDKADWDITGMTGEVAATDTKLTLTMSGVPSGAGLSYRIGSGSANWFASTSDTSHEFSNLQPASPNPLTPNTTYNLSVRAAGDANHNQSAPITILGYTAYAAPASFAGVLAVNYMTENLVFANGVVPSDYEVKINDDPVISDPDLYASLYSLTSFASGASNFTVSVRHKAVGNYPASAWTTSNPIVVREAKPAGITTTIASSASASDGQIVFTGQTLEYRTHSTADMTSGFNVGTDSVNVAAGSYDVRKPATVSKFGSHPETASVDYYRNQAALAVTAPGTLTYGTNTSVQLATTGGTGNGAVTYEKTDGDVAIATVSGTGLVTIFKAGTIKVRAVKAAGSDASHSYYQATSPEIDVVISPRQINISDVVIGITGPTVYTGLQLQPAYTVTDNGANATITASDYDVSWGANVAAGTNTGSVTLTGKENYTGEKTVTFNITTATQAAVTVTAPTPKTYGDAAFTISASGGSGTGALQYQLATNTDPGGNAGTLSGNTVTITKAGTIKVQAKRLGDSNYSESAWSTAVTITVNPKDLTVNVTINNKKYDGTTAATAASESLVGIVGSDAVTLDSSAVTYAFPNETADNVNTKAVTQSGLYALTGALAGNYTVTQPTLPFPAKITDGFTPVKGTHYTITTNDWSKNDFVVTAASGYKVSKTNTSAGDPWDDTVSWTGETAGATATFYVKRVDGAAGGIAQGEISVSKGETFKIDTTVPNDAKVNYEGKGLKGFLNTITFGWFFKASGSDPVDIVVTGYDTAGAAPSGVAKVEYYASTIAYTQDQATAIAAGGAISGSWTTTALSITYDQRNKYHIFAKVTDNAGNFTIFFDSVVVYAESAQSTANVNYTRLSNTDTDVLVTLNGNTVKSISQTAPSAGAGVLSGTNYTVSGGTITLKKEYLETLSAVSPGPTYTYEVVYNPQGVDNATAVVDSDNEETPAVTTFTVTVGKKAQAALTVLPPSGTVSYGDTGKTLTSTGGSDGAVSYEVMSGPATVVASTGVLTITGNGTVVVKAKRPETDDYLSVESATVNIEVGAAPITSYDSIDSFDAGKAWVSLPSEVLVPDTPAPATAAEISAALIADPTYQTVTAKYAGGTIVPDLDILSWAEVSGVTYNHAVGSYAFEGTVDPASAALTGTNAGNYSIGSLKPVVYVVVNDLPHGIKLDTDAHTFASKPYDVVAVSKTVTITNIGTEVTGKLKAELTGSDFELSAGAGEIATIAIGGTANFTVTPVSGLSVGTHTATLTVSYFDNLESYPEPVTSRTIALSYTVTAAEITGFAAIGPLAAGSAGSALADADAVKAQLHTAHPNVNANYAGVNTPVPVSIAVADWADTDSYDPTTPGSYTFTATPSVIPANFANTGNNKVTVEVVVKPADAVAPTIGTHPTAYTHYYTDQGPTTTPLSFTLLSNGNGTLSYQWYSSSTDDNTSGSPISGATNATYIPPVSSSLATDTYYYVVITASAPGADTPTASVTSGTSGTSGNARVKVEVRPAPALINQSVNRDSATAATIGFDTDQPGTVYYLVADTAPTAAEVVAANHSLGSVAAGTVTGLSVPLPGEGEKHIYVVVKGTTTDTNKNSNMLNITAAKYDNTPPTISTITPNTTGTNISGSITITFSEPMDTSAGYVTLSGGAGSANAFAPTNWTNNQTYVVSYSGLANSTSYTIAFFDFADTADNVLNSGAARTFVTRAPNAVAPVIGTHPQPADYLTTGTATALTVAASNNGNPGTLSYQWYYNDTNSNTVSGAVAVGGNSANYTPDISASGTRYYFCVVTNTLSNDATVKTKDEVSDTAKIVVALPKYTVKFDIGSGVGQTPADIQSDIGTSVALPTSTGGAGFALTDYTFGGWSLTPNPTPAQTDYPLGTTYTSATETTVTLYAVWVENVALIFNSEGGSLINPVHIDPSDVTYGDIAGWPANAPARSGYEFTGWYVHEIDGAAVTQYLVTGSDTIAAAAKSITLHAHWTALNTSAFYTFTSEIEAAPPVGFGIGAVNLHPENYPAGQAAAFQTTLANVKAAVAAATSQAQVDDALATLTAAYDALKHVHPVLYHSHDASAGGVNQVTEFGQTIVVEIRGEYADVIGFKLNSTDYMLDGPYVNDSTPRQITEPDGNGGTNVIGSITKNSAVVTLPAALTDRLGNGTHTIAVLFSEGPKSGSGPANIVVNRTAVTEPEDPPVLTPGADPGAGPAIVAPKTGDDMNLTLWFILMALALAALIAAAVMRRRRTQ